MPVDTMVMLELLNEAGDEAVTLDELEVAGVRDPARALLELELAGLEIQRVLVRGDRKSFECVRLAAQEAQQAEQPTVELAAVASRPAPRAAEESSRLRGVVLLAVLLALVALMLRRR
jgi:hypothetical protein